MTFLEIVDQVLDNLNLTSDDARERVERRVNYVYKKVTTSIGLVTSRRIIQTVTIDPTEVGSTLPDITIEDVQKVLAVRYVVSATNSKTLEERSMDEILDTTLVRRIPQSFAVNLMGPTYVTIRLDAYPTSTFTLNIEAYEIAPVLEGLMEPYFPEDFHDLLIEGVMMDELRKMEKPALAEIASKNYERRLSDLRYFIAKSSYMDIVQGKWTSKQPWYRLWWNRTF